MIGKVPSLKQVADAVGHATGVDPQAIYGTSRKYRDVHARHMVWYIANAYFGRKRHWIAKTMDRDHVTVSAGVARIEKQAKWDENTRLKLDDAISILDPRVPEPAPPKREFDPLAAVLIRGAVCSAEWWASNDANFRAGMARAAAAAAMAAREAKAAKLAAFLHVGKSVEKLRSVAPVGKSPLALPRNLCSGLLQSPTPDLMITQGH